MNQCLHFTIHFVTSGGVNFGPGQFQQFAHALVIPVGVIPCGTGGEGNRQHGVGGWTHIPTGYIQRFDPPDGAPVTIRRDLFDLQVESDFQAIHLGQQASVLNPGPYGGNKDLGAGHSGFFEVILRLVRIKFPLWQFAAPIGPVGAHDGLVIAHGTVPFQDLGNDAFPVLDILHPLDKIRIAAGQGVGQGTNAVVGPRRQ